MKNEVLENLEDFPEGGALLYSGSRHLFIQPAFLTDFQRAVEAELGGEKVGQMLYRTAHTHGRFLAAHFQDELALGQEETIKFMAGLSRQMGWGRVEITALDVAHNSLEMEVFHSAFAEEYGKAEFPICHFLRGVFAGLWQVILGSEVEGLETRCRALEGPGPCAFIFAAAAGRSGLKVSLTP